MNKLEPLQACCFALEANLSGQRQINMLLLP